MVVPTPSSESRWLSGLAGATVWLKCENLQRTGSFKIRGAYVRIARLERRGARPRGRRGQRRQPRAGRRARRAACSASAATVFMPDGAPIPKEKATRAYGADVGSPAHGRRGAGRRAGVRRRDRRGASSTRSTIPTSSPGRAPAAWRSSSRCPDVAHDRACRCGGGGLLAGIATAVQGRASGRAGDRRPGGGRGRVPRRRWPPASRCALEAMATMADGIAVGCPGEVPFAAVQQLRRRGA